MKKKSSDKLKAILAVDTGGTFTDFFLRTAQGIRIHKVLSTPKDPSRAILQGIRKLGVAGTGLVHGSTVATNAFLERKGAKVALITTEGFEDLIEIGRQNRPVLYDLAAKRTPSLISRARRFGIRERTNARGRVEQSPSKKDLRVMVKKIKRSRCDSVAVCLLFSYANGKNEKTIQRSLRRLKKNISVSSEICPEYREYERTSTTCINAYVAPIMSHYLQSLRKKIHGPVRIMQSNGGALSLQEASQEPIRTLLSGPAGGALGAFRWARAAGLNKIISLDMGGTSTDMSLIDGALELTSESSLGGFPIKTPMLRIHTIGAGGGSLAWVDQGGALRVGPQSAGAEPGPVCYGRGGKEVTLSDAHFFLGRLPSKHFLGGTLILKEENLSNLLKQISRKLKVSLEELAQGILTVANANMSRALRVLSLERGLDPREFTLVPFGGAGPLHACELADSLGMNRVLVPQNPGVLSAMGMAHADWVRDYVQTVLWDEGHASSAQIKTQLNRLKRRAWNDARREGFSPGQVQFISQLDVRYRGQSYELTVPATKDWIRDFVAAHRRQYGFQHQREREIVNLRLQARVPLPHAPFQKSVGKTRSKPVPVDRSPLYSEGKWIQAPLFIREKLQGGHRIEGPAIVSEFSATTYLHPRWSLEVDIFGNLQMTRKKI